VNHSQQTLFSERIRAPRAEVGWCPMALKRPDTMSLHMSGETENSVVHCRLLDRGMAFPQKPFLLGMLARNVREVLDGPPKKSEGRRAGSDTRANT
jgi:hypothetical protein